MKDLQNTNEYLKLYLNVLGTSFAISEHQQSVEILSAATAMAFKQLANG